MRFALVVCFLDEEEHLPTFLDSLARQSRPPDQVLLVDDGSRDRSFEIAAAFAAQHDWAVPLQRPQRPAEADRLVTAAELVAFAWGLDRLAEPWDVVGKLDADLELAPTLLEEAEAAFRSDLQLGMTGGFLALRGTDGAMRRERHEVEHVRGPNKLYRRACFEQIWPLPAHLGWDTVDELRARQAGWRTRSLELVGGDSVHLRPTGAHGGRLRAFRRWGECAWGFGAHPIWVLAGALSRARQRPRVLAGLHYAYGWAAAGVRRAPRAEPDLRRFARREELASIRRRLSARR